ncbi:polysaccharide deacetylase family sporulation protein PdaB [Sporomusaceae bacterium BoRhaA]|jgi:peptidoglycan-N-acetylglucosamine deacetylase|uniref:polysaccharide deacetylase family sporulation protein PdaB n=1 Tax=Pelorhabdus rhamnosifermentans TaxID=2772457 RepID=UPI001C061138|nr:polysaccharide deacetylase family sporulation protein PdaB [Pelorhabdus rhamnosifermentans]MBU2702884.1 polysaccharide deacetylase family sporulation protein PdaB [Pelorhabdus rhamnosifermentans]
MIINLRRFFHHRHIFYSLIGLFLVGTVYVEVADLINSGPIAIAGTRTDQKVVALTFDHSWGNKYTASILDTLKSRNIHATFFIMGPWAKKYPEMAQRIVQDKHEVGSHGYRHENYGDMTADWVKDDIQKAHGLIKEVTGVDPTLLRPPNGHYSAQSLKVTDELGYKTIIWNVDSLDWKNPGRDVIINRVMSRLKPGSIILLHASDTPTQTADALPTLLDRIQAEGYQIVTVGELLNQYSEKGILKH